MSKSIAGSLEKKTEKGVTSTLKELSLKMDMAEQRSVPEQKQAHLTHLCKERNGLKDGCDIANEAFRLYHHIYNNPEKGDDCCLSPTNNSGFAHRVA